MGDQTLYCSCGWIAATVPFYRNYVSGQPLEMSCHGWLYSDIPPTPARATQAKSARVPPRPPWSWLQSARRCPPPPRSPLVVKVPPCRWLRAMFGDTQAGCQRIAAAYNELLVRGIQPDRISEWFYGENGGLKVHVDACIRTGVCDAELLFHVRGFRSASLDGGSPKGVSHGVSREFRNSSCRLLSRMSSCRRLASNVRHYRRAVQRGSKGKFLRGGHFVADDLG